MFSWKHFGRDFFWFTSGSDIGFVQWPWGRLRCRWLQSGAVGCLECFVRGSLYVGSVRGLLFDGFGVLYVGFVWTLLTADFVLDAAVVA